MLVRMDNKKEELQEKIEQLDRSIQSHYMYPDPQKTPNLPNLSSIICREGEAQMSNRFVKKNVRELDPLKRKMIRENLCPGKTAFQMITVCQSGDFCLRGKYPIYGI